MSGRANAHSRPASGVVTATMMADQSLGPGLRGRGVQEVVVAPGAAVVPGVAVVQEAAGVSVEGPPGVAGVSAAQVRRDAARKGRGQVDSAWKHLRGPLPVAAPERRPRLKKTRRHCR